MYAVMIMFHKNVLQVARLVKACKTSKNSVFLHADSSLPEEEFKALQSSLNQKGVYFCQRRYHGVLDDRSLVDIVLEMIQMAKKVESLDNIHYSYYCLLSGQDYPIKQMSWIEKHLEKNYPKPYIDCTPYDKHNWTYHKFTVNKSSMQYHDWISRSFKKGVIRSAFRISEMVYVKLIKLFRKNSYVMLRKERVELYGGSAWWILPDKCIDFVIQEVSNNSEYISILLNESMTPEEHFFQVVTMRSPVNDLVEVNPKDMVNQNCKTWAYFSGEGKPFIGHPYIITKAEFDYLQKSEFWFARKFDADIDGSVLDMIDTHIS